MGDCFATPTRRIRTAKAENVSAYLNAVDGLEDCHRRLRAVEVRNLDAVKFIQQYDFDRCLFYVDPPYLLSTRQGAAYTHEMTDDQHAELLECLANIEGKFILSGYPSELYDDYANRFDWRRHDIPVANSASSKSIKEIKTESVWMNYDPENQPLLF